MKKIYFLKLENKQYYLIIKDFFYFIIYIIIILLIFLNNSFVQTKITKNILLEINKKYKTNILIDNISINLLVGNIKIKKFKILDKKNNVLITIPKIEGNINIFNLFYKKIKIKNLIINNPQINIITYKNDNISNITYFIKCLNQQKYYKNNLYNLSIINFDLKRAYINIINNNKYINVIFRGYLNWYSKKITFNKNIKLISSYISNIILQGKYINKNININCTNNNLCFNNKKLVILNNNLLFNKSKILSSFSCYYKKYEDLLNSYHDIFFSFIIKNGSYISSNEINLFINNSNFLLKKSIFHIQCNIRGIFNKNIDIFNLDIRSGKNIIKSKHIILYKKNTISLYFKQNTFIATSFFDIKKILPVIFEHKIPILLNNYGCLKYYGSIYMTYKYIKLDGELISSQIGILRGKILFFNFKKFKNIEYQGKLYININNLYPLLKNKNLKYINAEFIFSGKGDPLKNSNIHIIIKNVFIYNIKIHNINIHGDILNNCFYGMLYINDKNINIKFNGNFQNYRDKYFLHGKIQLKYLKFHFINDKNQLIYGPNMDISINLINFKKLNINLYNIFYQYSDNILFIPKIYINYILLREQEKKFILSMSNLMKLSCFGNFNWIELYHILIKNINKLLNNKEDYYTSVYSNQVLKFKINITNKLINIFYNKINYLYNFEIIGILSDKKLIIFGESKIIKYNSLLINNIKILLNNNKKYNIIINIDNIFYKQITIKNINIYTLINNNSLLINIYFLLQIYNINQEVQLNLFKKNYYSNGIQYMLIGLARSLIKINNNHWWINEKNETNYSALTIDLKHKKIIINELKIDFQNQNININSKSLNNKYNIIESIFKKILYKNYFNINYNILKDFFLIEQYNSIFIFEIKLNINNLYINNIYIENIQLNILHNINNKKIQIFLIIKNKNQNILSLSGEIKNFIKKNEYCNFKIRLNQLPIIFFEKLIISYKKNIFYNIRGTTTGIINLTGNYNNWNYKGYVYIKNTGIKINNINTDYEFIYRSLIVFKNKTIFLKNLIIRDTKYNTIGYVNGIIMNDKNKWTISLYIDSKNLLVMDTKKINNQIIYGIIFAKGKMHLLGDINNLNINVTNAKISNYSKLFINTTHNDTNMYNIENMIFLNKKYQIQNSVNKENNYKNIIINIESNIDEKCDIKLFFNSKKNTFIKVQGVGKIVFKTNSSGCIEMSGKYYIKHGYYQLYSATIPRIHRILKIKRGGTIIWVGLPNNPKLNITACYTKYVSNLEDFIKIPNYVESKNIRSELIINMYGHLTQPNFIFDIDFPSVKRNIKQQIIQKISTRDDKITQFGSIMLLGKFFIKKKFLKIELLSFYNNIFNSLISILSNIHNTKLALYYQDIDSIKRIKYSLIYDINKYFSIKGIIIFPISLFSISNINGEFEMKIDINKKLDKSLKIILFSRALNLYQEPIYNNSNFFVRKIYGGSIFYTVSFDKIKKLWNVFVLSKKY